MRKSRDEINAGRRERYKADPAKAKAQAKDWYANNTTKYKAAQTLRRQNNSAHVKALDRAAYERKAPTVSARNKKQYAEDPAKFNERSREWAKKNPVRRSELNRKRRAAKWGVEENFTPYQRGRVRKQFGRKCFRCGSPKKLQLDHHLPLSGGHALAYGNAVVLCRSCNSSKWNRQPADFYTPAELRRLEPYLTEQRTWASK